jgi:phage-related protein
MEARAMFTIIYLPEAVDFLNKVEVKARTKILSNIEKSSYFLDIKFFKKLKNTEIWEFRTKYNKMQYRLLAFWDSNGESSTLVVATNGFIKKQDKTPKNEVDHALELRRKYYEQK